MSKEEAKGEKKNGYNSFLATQIRMILNILKKEGNEVENIKKNDDKLYVIYNLGIQIHEELKHNNELVVTNLRHKDFESIGHSFLAGLISNKYEKKEEEKING